jgi:presenilin-like A22 family membrane protease
MKHTPKITLLLVGLFLLAQFVGLAVVNQYIDYETSEETGNFTVNELPSIAGVDMERPDIEEKQSPLYIFAAIIIGTILLLLIIKWGKAVLWKAWFFLAVALSLHFSGYAFLQHVQYGAMISLTLAIVLGIWKIWRPNIIVQNLTEIFLYGGLAAIFFSVVNIWAMVIILLLISVYDAYAVWKSKHMVSLAKFQTNSGVFAGLLVPYSMKALKRKTKKKSKTHKASKKKPALTKGKGVAVAVLGGGDMGFPLLFAAAVMKEYALLGQGWLAYLIPPFAAIALYGLLQYGKKDRFYPAMPFITVGCFVGFGVVWLVRLFL